MESGKIIRWMGKVNLSGLMAVYTLANTKMIKNMDKDHTNGQTVDFTKVDFIMENNMEKACTDKTMARMCMVYG